MNTYTYNPLQNRTLFWDVNLMSLLKNEHKDFILYRIIENGTDADIKWMLSNYSEEEIKEFICDSRRISRKSVFFGKID